jgi:hypothetical protein
MPAAYARRAGAPINLPLYGEGVAREHDGWGVGSATLMQHRRYPPKPRPLRGGESMDLDFARPVVAQGLMALPEARGIADRFHEIGPRLFDGWLKLFADRIVGRDG